MAEPLVHVDVPHVPASAAALFMAHHLSLAAAYYEATDVDRNALVEIIERSMHDIAASAAIVWLDHLDAQYSALDEFPTNEP